jgi:hypothetical protein
MKKPSLPPEVRAESVLIGGLEQEKLFQLDTLTTGAVQLHVLRDDLLPGGTKQRGCLRYLRELRQAGAREFVYASPFAGFAQVALSVSAALLGVRCTLFCERDKTVSQPGFHAFSRLAQRHGAHLVLCEDLDEAHARTLEYAREPSMKVLPLGFRSERFLDILTEEIHRVWSGLVAQLGHAPRELWVPVGSGTLLQCFHRVTAGRIPIFGVDVRVLAPEDGRITSLRELPGVTVLRTPERFHEPVEHPPPVPSNCHYDAKLWRFLVSQAAPSALWWNVAR